MTIQRMVGVYHAEGSMLGELRYVVGRLRGTTHCALCDITHRGVRAKAEWRSLLVGLPVPLEMVHLDERSVAVETASGTATPCVLALTVDGDWMTLLGPEDLDQIDGDVNVFERALRGSVARSGHGWP